MKRFKVIAIALTLALSSMGMSANITNINTANADEATTVTETTKSFLPTSYDDAKTELSAVDTSSMADEIKLKIAKGVVGFIWHVKDTADTDFDFVSDELSQYGTSTTSIEKYYNDDKTDEYVVYNYNIAKMSQDADCTFNLHFYNADKSLRGTYSITLSIATDTTVTVKSSMSYKKNGLTYDDWKALAANSPISVYGEKICFVYDKSEGEYSISLNGTDVKMTEVSSDTESTIYTTYAYQLTKAEVLDFIITKTDSEGTTTQSEMCLNVDDNLQVTVIQKEQQPTNSLVPTSFSEVEEFIGNYGNCAFSDDEAVCIVESDDTTMPINLTGEGTAEIESKNIYTDGTKSYTVYALKATAAGTINISVPINSSSKTFHAYLIAEDTDSGIVLKDNPNPPEETTEAPSNETTVLVGTYGDTNVDGNVTISDVVLLNKYLVSSASLSELQLEVSDTYKDENVDSKDSLVILKFLVRSVLELPVQPE